MERKKKRANRKFSHEEIAAALLASRGLATPAAAMLGCNVDTIYAHLKVSPLCKEAQAKATELVLDLAEGNLFTAIENSAPWAVSFFLARKARARGYSDKVDLTSADKGLQQPAQVDAELAAVIAKLGKDGLLRLLAEMERGK